MKGQTGPEELTGVTLERRAKPAVVKTEAEKPAKAPKKAIKAKAKRTRAPKPVDAEAPAIELEPAPAPAAASVA